MTTVVDYTSAGSGFWLCPAGLYLIDLVETWGGGGGGAPGSGGTGGTAGGGGEYAAETGVAVTPGKLYAWNVGTGGFSRGASFGGSTWFSADTLTVLAHGGNGGSTGGKGGRGSANTTHHNGGDGGSASGHAEGGGGGSSAGTLSAGANGGNASGGGSGGQGGLPPVGGAAGGQGGAGQLGGFAGTAPGGAGGGGATGGASIGGYGAQGKVQLTYAGIPQPQVPFFPAGYASLPSDWNNWIQAPLAFLTSRIVFRAEQSAALSLPSGTTTLIPFNSVLEDPLSGWESGASQWLCPPDNNGLYVVSLTVSCAPNGAKPVTGAIVGIDSLAQQYSVARSWVPAASGQPGIASGQVPVQLYGGQDGVSGYARLVGASSSVATTAGQRCQMVITEFAT